ncbi:PHD finger protein 21A-like [Uloborus diversus]|uniref:PHD finger protein 21A-like n=1 Tax=Uloborus diversus TaxID=327109 RepID=UPI00240A0623|nr:PHD finger protein 21A-like [Uloborus diversus]
MDLQTISSQMKVVIQKHQIVVTEMRNDPQNPVLQKRLHDLQLEIHSLNERQKLVIEGIRKNFGKKTNCSSPCSINSTDFSPSAISPCSQPANQEVRMVCCAQKCPMANHKIPTTTVVTKPIASYMNPVRQAVPPPLTNLATTFTFKAPVGTVVLPNCSVPPDGATEQHPKVHPVLVVPSPSNRGTDGTQTGVLLNLVPPIRVPQYPPPQSPRTPAPLLTCQKPQIINNCIPALMCSQPITTVPSLNTNGDPSSGTASSSPENFWERCPPAPVSVPEKINHKIDQKKKDFITALGLVTRDSLLDIKNKKMERKRRSTANPQFSNAALEERLRNAAAAQASAPTQKRPRGRPRLDTKPVVVCPTNGICALSENFKTTETPSPPENATSANSIVSSSSSPFSDSQSVVNGIHRQTSNFEEGKNVEQMLSGLCIVCTQPGDLVKCDTCAKQQHLSCMQPPLVSRPQCPWQCSDCQSRTVSLTVVQSYDMLKATKSDEKRKLLKKSLELRLKRSQLESRLVQLRELSDKQKSRQSDLQTSLRGIEEHLERVHSVINSVRLCS